MVKYKQTDEPLRSWSCKGCTNRCYLMVNGEVFQYCKCVLENRRNRIEWQGNYCACLEYTTDPAAEDKQVRIHPCMLKEGSM